MRQRRQFTEREQPLRLATIDSVPVLVAEGMVGDIRAAAGGRFDTMADILRDWPGFNAWIGSAGLSFVELDESLLGPAVPCPGQVFGVGLNYLSHLRETGRTTVKEEILPLTFTKFPSSITGPSGDIILSSDFVDWEVELVAVMGAEADSVTVAEAPDRIAGYLVGQDISDRSVQRAGQLSMGKSFRTFAPCGPYLVTPDELGDPHDLSMKCWVNEELVQDASTSDMLYNVFELVALVSAVTPMRPGDLLFTGTAAGVGIFRQPRRFLRPGDVVRSHIAHLGSMSNTCREAPGSPEPLAERWRHTLE